MNIIVKHGPKINYLQKTWFAYVILSQAMRRKLPKKPYLTYYINGFPKLFWISKYGTLTKLINNNLSDHDDLHFFNFYHKFIYVCGNFSLLNCTINELKLMNILLPPPPHL